MMGAVGFDSRAAACRLAHPFCGGVPTDVRITTRYNTSDFLPALMGVLHETATRSTSRTCRMPGRIGLSARRGMAVHESQSLFVEKQVGRSPAFWQWALPVVERHLGEALSLDDVLPHVHKVERGLIRVDADEVTYPLHVVLRYELEQDFIAGRLDVADIPEAWDAKMRDYLGLSTIDTPGDGPMQDVHWPSGTLLFSVLYAGGDDGCAAMGSDRTRLRGRRERIRRRQVRYGQRMAARKDLVAGVDLFNAGAAGAGDGRAARR